MEEEKVGVEEEEERQSTKDLVASELEEALRITQDLAQKARKVRMSVDLPELFFSKQNLQPFSAKRSS